MTMQGDEIYHSTVSSLTVIKFQNRRKCLEIITLLDIVISILSFLSGIVNIFNFINGVVGYIGASKMNTCKLHFYGFFTLFLIIIRTIYLIMYLEYPSKLNFIYEENYDSSKYFIILSILGTLYRVYIVYIVCTMLKSLVKYKNELKVIINRMDFQEYNV